MSSRGSAGRGLGVGRTVRLGEVLGLALGAAGLALGAAGLVLVAEGDGERVGEDTRLGAVGRVEETPPTEDEACGAEGVRVPGGGQGRSGA
ncbi:hypothetical protein [Micromonospora sp. NPDC047134]|uniref:hypothetical protein n=1 Tax=Micromonospora sp. NPDC047134 TaxID=3154340 RepID=UPI0033D8B22B